jgi:hypothetical protein
MSSVFLPVELPEKMPHIAEAVFAEYHVTINRAEYELLPRFIVLYIAQYFTRFVILASPA